MPYISTDELEKADADGLFKLVAQARIVEGYWQDIYTKAIRKAVVK